MTLLAIDSRIPGVAGNRHSPPEVHVSFTPRKYLGPAKSPITVYRKTGSRVRVSAPPSGTSVEKPVVPDPAGPTPTMPGWLSLCCSWAQFGNKLDAMSHLRSLADGG